MAIRNNLKQQFYQILNREHLQLKTVAEFAGMHPSNLSRLVARDHPTEKLVEILEHIGYDMEVYFVVSDFPWLKQIKNGVKHFPDRLAGQRDHMAEHVAEPMRRGAYIKECNRIENMHCLTEEERQWIMDGYREKFHISDGDRNEELKQLRNALMES